jgi:hypothetical protein
VKGNKTVEPTTLHKMYLAERSLFTRLCNHRGSRLLYKVMVYQRIWDRARLLIYTEQSQIRLDKKTCRTVKRPLRTIFFILMVPNKTTDFESYHLCCKTTCFPWENEGSEATLATHWATHQVPRQRTRVVDSSGAAPASMHVHGRAGKPNQLARNAKNLNSQESGK